MACSPLPQYLIDEYTAEVARLRALLAGFDTAITGLTANTVTSYMLNTGQTTQQVTRADLSRLLTTRGALWSQLLWLLKELNLDDGAAVYVRPGF